MNMSGCRNVSLKQEVHAGKKRGLVFEERITALLPLFRDEAHSVATERHSMNEVRDTIAHLNSGQVPVITADQSIYAFIKQVQWHWTDLYSRVGRFWNCKKNNAVKVAK